MLFSTACTEALLLKFIETKTKNNTIINNKNLQNKKLLSLIYHLTTFNIIHWKFSP